VESFEHAQCIQAWINQLSRQYNSNPVIFHNIGLPPNPQQIMLMESRHDMVGIGLAHILDGKVCHGLVMCQGLPSMHDGTGMIAMWFHESLQL